MDQQVRADDGCRLWATSTGDGTPLVLCHGGPGLWDYFDDVAEILRSTARVVRWDQRGCGRLQRRGPYSIAIRRRPRRGPRPDGRTTNAVLGHSWGAHLALRYTIEHPERVSHLIYVAGTGIDPDRGWHPHYERTCACGSATT
jgi:proline iminopeptidase